MSKKEFQQMFINASSLPSKEKAFSYIEAINPNSLEDALEVENDGIDRIFNGLRNW